MANALASVEKRFPTQLSTKSAFLLEFTHAQKPSYRPMPKHFLIFTCTLILEWLHRRQLWATQLHCIHGPRRYFIMWSTGAGDQSTEHPALLFEQQPGIHIG